MTNDPKEGWTKGPWQNGFDDLEGVVSVAPLASVGDGNVVCLPPDFRMEASYARWPANARLIAAAPSLYDALASLMTAVDYTRVLPGPKGAEIKSRALAALAAARGEPQ